MPKDIVRAEICVGPAVLEAYTANEPHPFIPDAFINYLSGTGMARSIGLAESTSRQKRLSAELKGRLPAGFTTRQTTYKTKAGGRIRLNLWTTDTAAVYQRVG